MEMLLMSIGPRFSFVVVCHVNSHISQSWGSGEVEVGIVGEAYAFASIGSPGAVAFADVAECA